MKRFLIVLLMITMAAGTMTAGGSQERSDKVEIVYYTFTASPHHLEDLDTIITQFNVVNPDIEIKVEAVGYNEYFTKLESMIVGGNPPDVFELNYENFVNYASKQVLLDLDPFVAADEGFSAENYRGAAYDGFSLNGRQFGLPATFSTSVLYYNKDLFDEAGVSYPQDDWSWEEAITAAKKLTDRDAGIWGLYSPIQFYEFFKKAAQNGGRLISEDGKTATIDAPENVEALEFMVGLINEHGVMPMEEQLGGISNEDAFAAGKIAMLVSGIWMFQPFSEVDFPWDIVVEPGLKQKATHFFADGVAVSKGTKFPEAAYKWIKFYTSSKAMADVRIETNWEIPAVSDMSLVDKYLKQSPPENREAVYESLENPIPIPVIAQQNLMIDTVTQAIDQVLYGRKTAAQALADANPQVQQLLK
jgi:multiple sugar transport system substrate-binding protein